LSVTDKAAGGTAEAITSTARDPTARAGPTAPANRWSVKDSRRRSPCHTPALFVSDVGSLEYASPSPHLPGLWSAGMPLAKKDQLAVVGGVLPPAIRGDRNSTERAVAASVTRFPRVCRGRETTGRAMDGTRHLASPPAWRSWSSTSRGSAPAIGDHADLAARNRPPGSVTTCARAGQHTSARAALGRVGPACCDRATGPRRRWRAPGVHAP